MLFIAAYQQMTINHHRSTSTSTATLPQLYPMHRFPDVPSSWVMLQQQGHSLDFRPGPRINYQACVNPGLQNCSMPYCASSGREIFGEQVLTPHYHGTTSSNDSQFHLPSVSRLSSSIYEQAPLINTCTGMSTSSLPMHNQSEFPVSNQHGPCQFPALSQAPYPMPSVVASSAPARRPGYLSQTTRSYHQTCPAEVPPQYPPSIDF